MPKLNLRTARRIKTASGEVLRLKGQGFSWANLTMRVKDVFGADLQGMWDFIDPASLYQDAAGTLPVTAFGDAIGLAVDKGPYGRHLSQATTPARPAYTADGARHDGVDDFLQAANAADWTFLHDGSGGTLGAAVNYTTYEGSTRKLIGTHGGSDAGSHALSIGAYNSLRTMVGTGESPFMQAQSSLRPEDVAGVMTSIIGSSSEDSISVQVGSEAVVEVAPSKPFSAQQPTRPIQTMVSPGNGSVNVIRRMFAVSRVPTESERDLLNAWLMEGVQ